MFDITKVAAQDQFILELNNANDTPLVDDQGTRLSVTLWGPGSKAARALRQRRIQQALHEQKRSGTVKLNAEDIERRQADDMAELTVSLNGWGYEGANDQAAIRACYADPRLGFILDQVVKAQGDWANFTKS
jgi:hypothetical protein